MCNTKINVAIKYKKYRRSEQNRTEQHKWPSSSFVQQPLANGIYVGIKLGHDDKITSLRHDQQSQSRSLCFIVCCCIYTVLGKVPLYFRL